MQSIDAALLAAQKPRIRKALAKIVLTGATTKTYQQTGANAILDIRRSASPWSQTAQVVLDNSDGTLTDLDLKGYKGVISWGATTSVGAKYSAKPPMWVVGYQLLSWATGRSGQLSCVMSLAGIPNLLALDKADVEYIPDSTDTNTVKTLIRQVLGDSGETILTCFDHCTAYDVDFDTEDALIDVYIPADSFRVNIGDNRRDKLKELLSWTGCVANFQDDDKMHVFIPVISTSTAWVKETAYAVGATVIPTTPNEVEYRCTSAGNSGSSEPDWDDALEVGDTISDGTVTWTVSYDYDYRLESTYHTFFNKSYRKRLVIPNYQVVESYPEQDESYTGYAEDTESSDLMEIRATPLRLRLASNAQATAIAEARIAHYKIDAEQGSGFAPMNVGAEEYDFAKIKDTREDDYRVGNIGSIEEHYTPGQFDFEFRFGSVETGGDAGTLIPAISEGEATAGGRKDWTSIIASLAAGFNLMAGIVNQLYQDIKDIKERLRALEKGREYWVELFDGASDTPSTAEWGFERGLPFTATGQIFFSPIIEEIPYSFVVYVIDQGTNFWKYDIKAKTWFKLTSPNYSATGVLRTLVPDDVDEPTAIWCISHTDTTNNREDREGIRLSKYTIGTNSWSDGATTPPFLLVINHAAPTAALTVGETVTGQSSGATGKLETHTSSTDSVAPFSETEFTLGETVEGGTSGESYVIDNPEGFGSTPNWVYYTSGCLRSFVYVSATLIYCWFQQGVTGSMAKCIVYNPTADTWTIKGTRQTLPGVVGEEYCCCAAINAGLTIVYGGAIGSSSALGKMCKYTVADDTYATSAAHNSVPHAFAYDKDKLPFYDATTMRQGYVDTLDDSRNENEFAANVSRTADYGNYFGVDDDWTYIIALARNSTPELMSVISGGAWLLGTINSNGLTEVIVVKTDAENYTLLIVDTETDISFKTDETASIIITEGIWNVLYPKDGDYTKILIKYRGL